MGCEPSFCEIALTWLAFRLPGNGVYKGFAGSLPLAGGEAVLDFGCGMGTVAHHAVQRLPGGRLDCLDVSKRWLAACRRTLRRCPNASFLSGNLYDMALPGGSYDVIYSHFVLHDIPNGELERIVPAMARLLKENGKLIFREPLEDGDKIPFLQTLIEHSGFHRESSRITDVPLMGNALENVYGKF